MKVNNRAGAGDASRKLLNIEERGWWSTAPCSYLLQAVFAYAQMEDMLEANIIEDMRLNAYILILNMQHGKARFWFNKYKN